MKVRFPLSSYGKLLENINFNNITMETYVGISMVEATRPRRTIRKWLAENARAHPVHYTQIAEDLERNPASVCASLSIEGKQAQQDNRPAYYVRAGPGLYQYNELC